MSTTPKPRIIDSNVVSTPPGISKQQPPEPQSCENDSNASASSHSSHYFSTSSSLSSSVPSSTKKDKSTLTPSDSAIIPSSAITLGPHKSEEDIFLAAFPFIHAFKVVTNLHHVVFGNNHDYGRYKMIPQSKCRTKYQLTCPAFVYNNSCIIFSAHRRKNRQDKVMMVSEMYTSFLVAKKVWIEQSEQAMLNQAKKILAADGCKQEEENEVLPVDAIDSKQDEQIKQKSAADSVRSLDMPVPWFPETLYMCHVSVDGSDNVWILQYYLTVDLFEELERNGMCAVLPCTISSFEDVDTIWGDCPAYWVRSFVENDVERIGNAVNAEGY